MRFNWFKSIEMGINARIGLGIMAIVALMLILTIVGIGYMSLVNRKMKDIVENNNVKMEMVQVMQNALRERAINMYIMTIVEDEFQKDEEFQRFNIYGTQYYSARTRLESLAMTEEEKTILEEIRVRTRDTQGDAQGVVDELLKGNALKHYGTIRNVVMPKQKMIYDLVVKLGEIQKQQTEVAVREAEQAYQNARKLMGVAGLLASILVILIALWGSRKVLQQAHALQHQAFHDELTGLPNRALFLDRLTHAISRSSRDGVEFAIILLDLDRFKEVNDTMGHIMGDSLLQEVSRRLTAEVRGSDTVARLGGDEFVILLERIDVEHAPYVAEKLRNTLEQPCVLSGQLIDVSGSFGIAYYPHHGEDSVTLLKKADVAMYAAKGSHTSVAVYSRDQEQATRIDLNFKSELIRAIEQDELLLHFQPKVDIASGRVTSVEALVRWQHPQRGFLPPDMFIPMAEQIRLIDQLTFWVLRKSLAQSAEFKRAGMNITVAVNLSARSLQDIRLPGEIARILSVSGIDPAMLVLEITESAVMHDPVEALEVLQVLDHMGVTLAIDDFGTGYSSLSYLSKLPVDEIKIDKSFVQAMMQDRQASVIVHSTIELGHNLGMKVVAEGVENAEVWNLLSKLGCDTAQGYYMSKPLPAELLMAWLRESRWRAW